MPTVVQTTILTADNRISPILEKIGTDTGLLKVKMQADFALISKSVEALNEQLGGTSSAITAKLAQTATAVDGSSTTMGSALGKVETRANAAAGALRGTAKAGTSLGEGLTAAAGGTDLYAKSVGELTGLTKTLNGQLTTFNEQMAGVNQRLLDNGGLVARTGETNALTDATERAVVAQRTLNRTPSAPPGGLTPQARYDYMRGRPIAEPRPTRAVYEGVGGVASGAQRVGLGVTAASAFGLYEVSQFFKGGVAAAASANLSPAVEKAMENAVLKLYSKTPVGFSALFQMFQSAAETFQQGGKSNQQYIKELTQIVMAGLRSAVGTGAQQPEVISQALARVLHGFSIDSTKAEKVMDILHSVAAYSGAGTRVETLAQNMARSSALAPIVGISLPQWGSLYAELSKQFRPQQTDTLLRQLEQNIRAGTKGEGSSFMQLLGLTTAPSKLTGADLPVNLWSTAGIKKYGIYNVIEMLQQRIGQYVHDGYLTQAQADVGLTRLAPQLRGGSALAYLMTPGRLEEARKLGGRLGAEQGPILPGGLGTERVAADVKGVTERYFKEMMKQPGAQLTVAWHDIVTTAIKLGEVLAPAAERAAKQLERLTKIIEPWISKHPGQTTTIAEAGIGALIAGYFVKQGLGAGKTLVNLFTGTSGLLGYRVGAAGVGAGAGGAEGAATLGTAGSAGIGAAVIGGVALYLVSAFKGQEFQQATAQAGLGTAIAGWWKSNIIDKVLTVLGMATPGIAPGTALAALSKAGGPGAVMGNLGGALSTLGHKIDIASATADALSVLGHKIDVGGNVLAGALGALGHKIDLGGVSLASAFGALGHKIDVGGANVGGLLGSVGHKIDVGGTSLWSALGAFGHSIDRGGKGVADDLGMLGHKIDASAGLYLAALGGLIDKIAHAGSIGAALGALGHRIDVGGVSLGASLGSLGHKIDVKGSDVWSALGSVGHKIDLSAANIGGSLAALGHKIDLGASGIGGALSGLGSRIDHFSFAGLGASLSHLGQGLANWINSLGSSSRSGAKEISPFSPSAPKPPLPKRIGVPEADLGTQNRGQQAAQRTAARYQPAADYAHPGKAVPAVTVRIQAGPSTQLNPTGSMVYVPGGPPAPIFTVTAPTVRPPRTARPPSYGAPYAGDLGPFTVGPAGRAAFGEEPGVLAAYQKFIASVEKLPRDLQGYMEKAAQTFRTSLNTEEALHNKNLGNLTATYNARAQGYYQQYNQNIGRIVSTAQETSLYGATRLSISMSRANQLAIVSAQTMEGNHNQQIATLKRQRTEAMGAATGGKDVQYPWMTSATGKKTPAQIWQDFQQRIDDANKTYERSMHALESRLGITGTAHAKGFEAWLSHQDFSSKTRMSTAWDTYQREIKGLRLAYYGPDGKGDVAGSIGKENDRHAKVIAKLNADLAKASTPAKQWSTLTSSVAAALSIWMGALNYALLTGASTAKALAGAVKATIANTRLDLIKDQGNLMVQQGLADSGKYLDLKAQDALIQQQTDNAKSRQQIGISARELDDPNYIFALANKQRYGATTSLQDAQKQFGVDQLLVGDQQYLATLVQTQKVTEEDNLLVGRRNLLTQATLAVDEQHLQTKVDQAKVDAASALVSQQEANTVQQRLIADRQYLAIQAATSLAQVKGNILSQQQSAILSSILSKSTEYISSLVELGKATLIAAVAQDGLNLTVAGLSMDLGGIGSAVSSAIGHVTTLWQQAVAAGAGYLNQYSGALVQAYQEQEAVNDANNRSNVVIGLLASNLSLLNSGLQGMFTTAKDKIDFWGAALGRGVDGINVARGNILDLAKAAIKSADNLGSLSDVISGLTQVVSSIGGAAGTEFMRTGAISPDTLKAYGASQLALTQASWDEVAKNLILASSSNDLQGYIAALGDEIDLYKKKLGSDALKYGSGSPQVAADQATLQGLIKEWTDMSAALTQMTSSIEDNAKVIKGYTDSIDSASKQLQSDTANNAERIASDNDAISRANQQLVNDLHSGASASTIQSDRETLTNAQKQLAKDTTDGADQLKTDRDNLSKAQKDYQDYLDSISRGKQDFQLLKTDGLDPATAALKGLTVIIDASATDLAGSLTTAGQGATDLGTTLSKLGVDLTTLDTGIKDLAQIIADAVKAIGNAIAGLGGGGGAGAVGEGGGSAEVAARSSGAVLTPFEKAYAGFPSLATVFGSGATTGSGNTAGGATTAPSLTTIAAGFPQTVTGAIGSTSPLISVAQTLPQTVTGLVGSGETSAGGTSTASAGQYMKVVNDDGSVSYVWVPSYQAPTTSTGATGTGYTGLTGFTGLPSIGGSAATWTGTAPSEQNMIDSSLTSLPSITSPAGTWDGLSHTETNNLGQQSYYPNLPPATSPTGGTGTPDPTSLLNQIANNTGATATNTDAINKMDPAAVAMQLRTLLQNLINVAPAQSAIRMGNVKAGIDELINELGTTTTSQAL